MKSIGNLQTFAVFSKRGFTRQTTSDWPKILCRLLIPSQQPPYRILLKTHKPISLCPRELPSDSAKCPRNMQDKPTSCPRFRSLSQTARANCAKFCENVPLAKKHSHTKFQGNRSTPSRAIPIGNSVGNLQTFAVFSKRKFTRQTTSDWAEILCGLLIPPQLPPYKILCGLLIPPQLPPCKILIKFQEPISLCPKEVPSDSSKCPRNMHDAPMTPPRF